MRPVVAMVVVPRLPAFSVRNIAHTIHYYYNAKTVVNQWFINSVCLAFGGEQTGKWSSLGRRSGATNKQKRKPVPSSVGLHCDCAQMHRTRQTATRTDHIPSVSISPVNRPPHSHPTHTHTHTTNAVCASPNCPSPKPSPNSRSSLQSRRTSDQRQRQHCARHRRSSTNHIHPSNRSGRLGLGRALRCGPRRRARAISRVNLVGRASRSARALSNTTPPTHPNPLSLRSVPACVS